MWLTQLGPQLGPEPAAYWLRQRAGPQVARYRKQQAPTSQNSGSKRAAGMSPLHLLEGLGDNGIITSVQQPSAESNPFRLCEYLLDDATLEMTARLATGLAVARSCLRASGAA